MKQLVTSQKPSLRAQRSNQAFAKWPVSGLLIAPEAAQPRGRYGSRSFAASNLLCRLCLLAMTGLAVAILLTLAACDQIDRCLDSGGKWDKDKQECIY